MNEQDPNITVLELVISAIGALKEEFVLVGGCSVGLLITETGRPPVRETIDVDMTVQVASLTAYQVTCERLRSCGFREALNEDDHMFRWRKDRLILDVVPTEAIFGHSVNRWYPLAATTAESTELPSGERIRIISPPLLVATKLEAFHGRGNNDYMHHDIEDIVNLLDGRPSLADEIASGPADAYDYIRDEFEQLLTDSEFIDGLPGHFSPNSASQARVPIVIERMRKIAGY